MATYVNDLRLKEIGTGESSGTWGTETNVNLELIGEALGYGTEGITTNADTHTTTVADGSTDPGRAMYIEYTGTLDSACTVTIAPNTLSRLHYIENGTSGSQNIIIKQGSGATVTIPPGDTKAVYLDGAGSGAKVVDVFASFSVVDLKVQDDLTVTDDATVGGTLGVTGILTCTDDIIIGDGKTIGSASDVDAMTIAANGQVTFTQTLIGTALDISGDIDVDGTANLDIVDIDGATNIAAAVTMATNNKIQFRDDAIHISSTADGQLDLVADTEIQIAATTIDINGAINASGEIIAASLDISGNIDVDGTTNLDVVDIDGAVDMASTLTVGSLLTVNDGAVFNEGSADKDFRVESNGNTHMLFVDGGNNKVGIGAGATPDFTLDVADETDGTIVEITGNGTNSGGRTIQLGVSDQTFSEFGNFNPYMVTTASDSASTGLIIGAKGGTSSDSGVQLWSGTASAGMAERLRADRAGNVVINEQSYDMDFRVESNGNANMLFVDGGSNHVNIGTSTDHGGTLNVETSDNSVNLVLACTDTNGSSGPILDFTRDAGNVPSDGDIMGKIRFRNDDTNLDMTNYVELTTVVSDVSNGTEDGQLQFNIIDGGTLRNFAHMTGTSGTVFNEDSNNIDFRVESDGNTHMLFVDGGNDAVGVGCSTVGNSTLEVRSTGVDGTFANAIGFQYSGNASEANTISTSVSSNASQSGMKFNISDGGGSAGKTNVATFLRNQIIFNDDSNDQDFRIESNANANMFLLDGGNNSVGIGDGTPGTEVLLVSKAGNQSETAPHVRIQGAGYSGYHFLDGTAYYIGQNSAARALRLYSGAESAGVNLANGGTSFGTFSDERLKENIQDIGSVIEKIKDIRCVTFTRNDVENAQETIGFIAQDFVGKFDQVLDESKVLDSDEETRYSIKYTETIPVLLKAIQEQQTQIDALQSEINLLKGE